MMTKYHGRFQSKAPPLNQFVYSLASMYVHIQYILIQEIWAHQKNLQYGVEVGGLIHKYYSHGDDDVEDGSSCRWILP